MQAICDKTSRRKRRIDYRESQCMCVDNCGSNCTKWNVKYTIKVR